jgi:hypothetical protein
MNLLILLGIVVVGAIFTVQNMQVVSLYFLGHSTTTAILTFSLPLSFWVLGFTLAGVITSLFLRSFLRSPRPSVREYPSSPPKSPRFPASKPPSDWVAPSANDWVDKEDVDSWFPEEENNPPIPKAEQSDRTPTPPDLEWQSDLRQKVEYHPPQPNDYFNDRPKQQTVDIRLDPQWQDPDEEDLPEPSGFKLTYDPPPTVNPPRQVIRPPAPPSDSTQETPQYRRSQFEVPQQPKSESRQGTIYSYTYKDPRDRQKASHTESSEEKPDGIFDVNYRLLNPPTRPTEDLVEEDEEWL